MNVRYVREPACVFQHGVTCFERINCAVCGWRPEVSAGRRAEIRRRMERDTDT